MWNIFFLPTRIKQRGYAKFSLHIRGVFFFSRLQPAVFQIFFDGKNVVVECESIARDFFAEAVHMCRDKSDKILRSKRKTAGAYPNKAARKNDALKRFP